MVSMKDIAQRCGVSVATVSKALNGQQDIGEDTRRRICIAAEKMGYMTNSAARAQKFYEHLDVSSEVKRLFVEQIRLITCAEDQPHL